MSEIEAAGFGRFLPIKCPDEKVNTTIYYGNNKFLDT